MQSIIKQCNIDHKCFGAVIGINAKRSKEKKNIWWDSFSTLSEKQATVYLQVDITSQETNQKKAEFQGVSDALTGR